MERRFTQAQSAERRGGTSGSASLFGAVETGGTTTRAAVGDAAGGIVARAAFATAGPRETLERAVAFLASRRPAAVGVAAFGPICIDPGSPDHGRLLETPKPGWSRFPLRAELERALSVPIQVETDVNAAALAEQSAARAGGVAAGTLVYVTVGTGVGVGIAVDGRAHHGALHPEAGHLRVRRADDDPFAGCCPFHGDCLEGLASGPALRARTGSDPSALPHGHDAWRLEADLLAQLVVALVGVLAPHQVVLGGGVMEAAGLLDRVRARSVELSGGYSPLLADAAQAGALIVPPRLGGDSGLVGALRIAAAAG